jgi:succinyl-CoA synthetase alpha subunit
MEYIIDENTRVVVQGITGKEGSRATKEMMNYGTKVSCGVTPGKGGLNVHGLKVFDSVEEAIQYDSKINTSVLYVPPLMVFDAAMEAISAGIKTIVIVTENVPVKDSAKLIEFAKKYNSRIIGPASVGVLRSGISKVGSIGGPEEKNMYSKGNIGIISKSGGMCAETALILTQQGIGQSTVVGIGGDAIIGSTFSDILKLFENDDETEVVVIYGETGGLYEEQIATMIKTKEFTKPVVAFISGRFIENVERSLAFGHAGAIIEHGIGKTPNKKKVLKEAGVLVADYHYEIPALARKALEKK